MIVVSSAFQLPAAYGQSYASRLPTGERVIALTFDDHFEPGVEKYGAREILDILGRNGIKCTFFVTGALVAENPDLIKEIVNRGHEIGNHTYSHAYVMPASDTRERLTAELAKTDSLLEALCGASVVPFWRAPYGNVNKKLIAWAEELGLAHVGWTFDTLDWEFNTSSKNYLDPPKLLARYVRFLSSDQAVGAIVLCHLETQRKKDHLFTVLQAMIEETWKRGFRFVKVSEYVTAAHHQNGPKG